MKLILCGECCHPVALRSQSTRRSVLGAGSTATTSGSARPNCGAQPDAKDRGQGLDLTLGCITESPETWHNAGAWVSFVLPAIAFGLAT